MMKKFLMVSLTIFFGVLLISGSASAARVYVDINAPTFRLIPIAITDFAKAAGSGQPAESGISMADYVRRDLSLTGIFNILNKQSFLGGNDAGAAAEGKINFADWTAVGADYLLTGSISQQQKEIIVEGRLFDVVRGELIFNKKYRAEAGRSKGIARAIAADIMRILINDEGDFNTRIAFVSKNGLRSDIRAVSYDGVEINNLTNHQSILMAPRWSADGRWLAFTSFKRGRPEVYIKDFINGTEKRVASFDGMNLCGAFSPDGKKLLLTLSKEGNGEIYTMDTGTLKVARLTNNYAIDVSPAWSPDGRSIAFVSSRSGSPQIYTMNADGGNVKRITYSGSYNTSPSWSPRGDRIAYEGLVNGKYQIFSVDADGNNPLQLTTDAADSESPSWSPSGRQIVYVSRKNSRSKIIIMNSNGSNPRVLHESGNKLGMPSWSPRLK